MATYPYYSANYTTGLDNILFNATRWPARVAAAILVIRVLIWIISAAANWKIFEKANQPKWASIIPFYNSYISYKIYWGNGWLFLVPICLAFISMIPIICFVALFARLAVYVLTCYKKQQPLGRE